MKSLTAFVMALVLFTIVSLSAGSIVFAEEGEIRLLVRGDDIGSSHAANVGCIKSYQDGIMRSVEVMVPCPWFKEAAKMLRENPGLDVGIHLTLTSEWEFYKWGPITHAPSLVDDKGSFLPMTSQQPNFSPNTGFRESNFKLDEVEKELRAQIELALKEIPQISHLSSHMGTSSSTPELQTIVQKLSQEYNLSSNAPGAGRAGGFGGSITTFEQKEATLLNIVENLKPGTWMMVDHPGMDTPEMREIGHIGYRHVAVDRDGVTRAFCSERVKSVIEQRGIKLISYADLYE